MSAKVGYLTPMLHVVEIDPDGYKIEIGHWGKAEQEEWHHRLSAKAAKLHAQI